MNSQDWIAQIDALLSEANGLRGLSKYDDRSDLQAPLFAVDVRLADAIRRLAPAGSAYVADALRARDLESWERVPRYVGILVGLRADIASGWVESLAEIVHAATFNDSLDQASELNAKSYKDAAAVIAGSTLESHLRLLAAKHGIAMSTSKGPKKADTLNADLVKAAAYNGVQQKAITAWLGIRNAAAHGDYSAFDGTQVRQMIDGMRGFLASTPA